MTIDIRRSFRQLKNNAFVRNSGHFHNEIDLPASKGLEGMSVDEVFVFPVGQGVIVHEIGVRLHIFQTYRYDVFFVPVSSRRKWRICTFLHSVRRSMSSLRPQRISSARSRGVARPLMFDKGVLDAICLHTHTLKSSFDLRRVSITTEYYNVEAGKVPEKWFSEFFTILTATTLPQIAASVTDCTKLPFSTVCLVKGDRLLLLPVSLKRFPGRVNSTSVPTTVSLGVSPRGYGSL